MSLNSVLSKSQYNALPIPAPNPGDSVPLQSDAAGNLKTSDSAVSYTQPVLTNGNRAPLSVDNTGYLRVKSQSASTNGDVVTAPRQNQAEVNFSSGDFSDATILTNTTSGTGTATQSNGQGVYSSGGTSGGRATGKSVQALFYRPGHEWYAVFSAAFSTGGTGAGFQRLGAYNATDGFFVGYEGSTFNFTQFKAGVATSIPRSSWNGDPLDGSANSAFTSSGVPVAIDFTKLNIFRIRGVWFGSAPVRLEVFSPDEQWIICHLFHFPNTLTAPYTATTNWVLTVDVQSASATPVSISTPCWAMGVADALGRITETLTDNTLAETVRAVITGHTTAAGGAYVNVKVDPSGALTVAATQSTSPWVVNETQIAGSAISTAASGTQKVGIVGNAGATMDSTVGAGTAPTNQVVTGMIANSSAPSPTAGQAIAKQCDLAGNLRVNPSGPAGSYVLSTATAAAGSAIDVAVPSGKKWIVYSAFLKVAADANVATRVGSLLIKSSGGDVVSARSADSGTGITAGQTGRLCFGPGVPDTTVGPGASFFTSVAFPFPISLPAGAVLQGDCTNRQAGDVLALNLAYIELPD